MGLKEQLRPTGAFRDAGERIWTVDVKEKGEDKSGHTPLDLRASRK